MCVCFLLFICLFIRIIYEKNYEEYVIAFWFYSIVK